MKYLDAEARCKADGSYLATPRSYYENQFLIDLFPSENIWIGVNDISWEGKFVSVDGYPMYYTRWAPNEPSQSGNEDGVHIVGTYHGMTGKWNDAAINNYIKFVCFRRI